MFRYYFVLLFLLSSCLPEPTISRGKQLGSGSGTGDFGSDDTQTEIGWNYLGGITKSIMINVSNLNNSYLIGEPVEKFLGTTSNSQLTNFTNQEYCLVTRFKINGVEKDLRSKVTPISYVDQRLRKTVRVFRVDFPEVSASETSCNGNLFSLNPSGEFLPTPSAVKIYNPSQLCTTCTTTLTALKVNLFKKNFLENRLEEIPASSVNVTGIGLAVDPNNSVVTNPGTCTQSDCISRGMSCCLDNQCVKDGGTRPSAITQYPDQYNNAQLERLQNPLAYLNYPHIYYVCGTVVPPATTGGTSSGGGYDEMFEQKKKDHSCIQLIKSKAISNPFHNDLINNFDFSTFSTPDCKTTSADTKDPRHYIKVFERLYQTCGCVKTKIDEMVVSCPAYEYVATRSDSAGVPLQLDCYTPPSTSTPGSTQLSVTLNSRSAPHRFFNKSGQEIDPKASSTEQEGDTFSYADFDKVIPVQSPFSMNAILGQMSVKLDQALPAKSVPVNLDQVYLLSTISGSYTPCPSCNQDQWIPSYTAFPTTVNGVGLQSYGFTTQRDVLNSNAQLGNYEDTIFGRACWIPPTMIPFSHSSKTSAQEQRLNRLKTQAALFSNGYQRDWYGFNKGALIGSFDGVSWFAIGKGRIVRATSRKLFLAINAPFADLASANPHVVNVQAYDGITQAAQVDYDPQYHLSHAYQNEAGSCQANHMCSTDTDCITRLGWEYMCADVRDLKTQWPGFDANGDELSSTTTPLTLDQILQQKRFPSSSTKRCIYRGAGSPCLVNSGNIADLNKRKTLSCAPNFYCANLNSGSAFNSKISRYANELENLPIVKNHFFGRDAKVLGRPLSYISSNETTSLTSDIRTTISSNISLYEPSASFGTGLCRPGKALPELSSQATLSNPYQQHMFEDAQKRTDYISQIGGCNSALYNEFRHSSCPVIKDGNYEMFSSTFVLSEYVKLSSNQNACGLESLYNNTNINQSADALNAFSPFKSIEAKTLPNQTIIEPTLVRDACLRRAGQVCQTDLDCSPNKFHAYQTENFSMAYFGNDAERNYYSEYLVCGQTDPKPLPGDTEGYKTYDLSKNQCCREVGKDFTSFTSDVPLKVSPVSTDPLSYDKMSKGLKPYLTGSVAPSNPKRYSRFASVQNLGRLISGVIERPYLSAFQDRNSSGVLLNDPEAPSGTQVHVHTPYQWKTLGEANSSTCCGGGWIRKFSDGGTDWKKRNRLYLDVNNFRCLNSRTPVLSNPEEVVSQYNSSADLNSLLSQDYGEYCKDPSLANDGCALYSINDDTADKAPLLSSISTIALRTGVLRTSSTNRDLFFAPVSADSDPSNIIDYAKRSSGGRLNIVVKVPSFIPRSFDTLYSGGSLSVRLYDLSNESGGTVTCTRNASANVSSPTQEGSPYCTSACCYFYEPVSRMLKIVPGTMIPSASSTQKFGLNIPGLQPAGFGNDRTLPGSSSYYLRRLAKLELTGIPQVTYPPLYCNDTSSVLIPGLYKPGVKYRSDFETAANAFQINSEWYTNQYGLASEPIFSANDFKCCTPLGKTTTNTSKCCSGFGTPIGNAGINYTCALPPGANLMVYFNRYVSNEGRGSEQPGGGLIDSDFENYSGEPKTETLVIQKLTSLGNAYCSTKKVRQGGAFGAFEPEPQGPNTDVGQKIYGIVDSYNDFGKNSNTEVGYDAFMEGFRWNNHLYCDD